MSVHSPIIDVAPLGSNESTHSQTSSRLDKSMNNAVRTRQRMLAVSLPITAALYIGAEGINPKGTDQIV